MPERFKVVCIMQGAIQVLCFTFTFLPSIALLQHLFHFIAHEGKSTTR